MKKKKVPINNLKKPPRNEMVNGAGMEIMEVILNEMPNLKEDKN